MSTDGVFERFILDGWVVSRESVWEDLGFPVVPVVQRDDVTAASMEPPSLAGDVANARILDRSPGARVEPDSVRVALPEGFEPTPQQRAAQEAAREARHDRAAAGLHEWARRTAANWPQSDLPGGFERLYLNQQVAARPTPAPIGYWADGATPSAVWFDETHVWADSGFSCARLTEDGCACPECRTRHAEIEAGEAVWLDLLSRETEVSGSPWDAAMALFGREPVEPPP